MSFVFDIFTQQNPDGTLGSTFAGLVESIAHGPSRVRDLGLYGAPEALLGTTVTFETSGFGIDLISDSSRQSAPGVVDSEDRDLVLFRAGHIKKSARVTEEDIRDIRKLGFANQFDGAKAALTRRLRKPVTDVRTTNEWKYLSMIRGRILDANGVTERENMFTKLGLTQRDPIYLELDSTDLVDGDFNNKVSEILDMIANALGGLTFQRVHCFVNSATMRKIKNLPEVRRAYALPADGATTRSESGYGTVIEYAGVTFETYRGQVNGVQFVSDDELVFFPIGAGNFWHGYAPANRIEDEYQIGQPEFYIPKVDPEGQFEEVQVQSNPLILNLRPLSTVIAYFGTDPAP